MKKKIVILCLILLFPVSVWAGEYNYISQEDMLYRLGKGPSMLIVDINPAEQFAKGHLPGAIETNAYPVKTKEEKARLDKVLPSIQRTSQDMVIVCPRGGGGAKRAFDHYLSKNVDPRKMYILEKGMRGWPYATE